MALEIERKFLVQGTAWATANGRRLTQGYLNRDKRRTVRVRVDGELGYLTIKGESVGATRTELEYPIPVADAQALLDLCDGPLIDKTRHTVVHAGMVWEVDEFHGDNQGLVVAEVELTHEAQAFESPPWLGVEVTHDARYFNSALVNHPYSCWA